MSDNGVTTYAGVSRFPAVEDSAGVTLLAGVTDAVTSGQVPTPSFSPGPGVYTSSQSVTVNCALSGVSMYYTTDGSTPTNGSTAYTVPIVVAASETIKVLAVKATYTDSYIATAGYVIVVGAILTESGGFVLLEDGGQILLET